MEKLPHYNFSWTVSLQKICEKLRLEIRTRSHSLEISVWKRLWTCRETDTYLNLGVDEPASNGKDLTLFKYALVTSCDVERNFSSYKTILSDNRRRFLLKALKMHIVIYSNAAKKAE
jgi:hypothetical protein